jgi:hypothetical protein
MNFEELECLLNQVSQVLALSLAVVDLVTEIVVADLEEIEDRKDLSVVGNESLSDGVGAGDEGLQNLQGD